MDHNKHRKYYAKDSRIIVQIIDNPLSYFGKIFFLKFLNQIIYFYITKCCKNARINSTRRRIPLTLIKNTSPIWKVLINKFYQDLVIIFNTFCIQDFLDTFEELGCKWPVCLLPLIPNSITVVRE